MEKETRRFGVRLRGLVEDLGYQHHEIKLVQFILLDSYLLSNLTLE